jgi:hypothetical protein
MRRQRNSTTPPLSPQFYGWALVAALIAFTLLPVLALLVYVLGVIGAALAYLIAIVIWLLVYGAIVVGILGGLAGLVGCCQKSSDDKKAGVLLIVVGAVSFLLGGKCAPIVGSCVSVLATTGNSSWRAGSAFASILVRDLWLDGGAWKWPGWLLLLSLLCIPVAGMTILTLRTGNWLRTWWFGLKFVCPECRIGRVQRSCPECATRFGDLEPSRAGIFSRACECMQRLPTSDFRGRCHLPVSCNRCSASDAFPDYGAVPEKHLVLWGPMDEPRLTWLVECLLRLHRQESHGLKVTPHSLSHRVWEAARRSDFRRESPSWIEALLPQRLVVLGLQAAESTHVNLFVHIPTPAECLQSGLPPGQPLDAILVDIDSLAPPISGSQRHAADTADWNRLSVLSQAIERQFDLAPYHRTSVPVLLMGEPHAGVISTAESAWRQRFVNSGYSGTMDAAAIEYSIDWMVSVLNLPTSRLTSAVKTPPRQTLETESAILPRNAQQGK